MTSRVTLEFALLRYAGCVMPYWPYGLEEFLTAAGVAQPSSVTRAINRLSDRGLIYDSPEGYRFFSPFFRTWLLTQDL